MIQIQAFAHFREVFLKGVPQLFVIFIKVLLNVK